MTTQSRRFLHMSTSSPGFSTALCGKRSSLFEFSGQVARHQPSLTISSMRSSPSVRWVINKHSAAARRIENVVHQLLCAADIEMRRRLVEDQHRPLREERPCKHQALALPHRRGGFPPLRRSLSSPCGSEITQSAICARRSDSRSNVSSADGLARRRSRGSLS